MSKREVGTNWGEPRGLPRWLGLEQVAHEKLRTQVMQLGEQKGKAAFHVLMAIMEKREKPFSEVCRDAASQIERAEALSGLSSGPGLWRGCRIFPWRCKNLARQGCEQQFCEDHVQREQVQLCS